MYFIPELLYSLILMLVSMFLINKFSNFRFDAFSTILSSTPVKESLVLFWSIVNDFFETVLYSSKNFLSDFLLSLL